MRRLRGPGGRTVAAPKRTRRRPRATMLASRRRAAKPEAI